MALRSVSRMQIGTDAQAKKRCQRRISFGILHFIQVTEYETD